MLRNSICLIMLVFHLSISAQNCISTEIKEHLKKFWSKSQVFDTMTVSNLDKFLDTSNTIFREKNKNIFFMGSFHMSDISNRLFHRIDSAIYTFKPEIVLVENYNDIFNYNNIKLIAEATKDAGYVSYVASEKGIRVKSWDNIPIAYNKLIPIFGYDRSLVFFLNSIGNIGISIQNNADNYKTFIEGFQLGGGTVTPKQSNYTYYLSIFEKYFKEKFMGFESEGFQQQRAIIQQDSSRLQFNFQFSQLRDEGLLTTLRTELLNFDNLYIQAGAAHFLSTKDIIPDVMRNAEQMKRSKASYGILRSDKNEILVSLNKGIKSICKLLISFVNCEKDDGSYVEKQITQFNPYLVLTKRPAIVGATKETTNSWSGIAGVARYYSLSKNIALGHWAPSWNDIYYHFVKKYGSRELYTTCSIMSVLEQGNITTISDFKTKLDAAGNIMWKSGYPFARGEFELNFLIQSVIGTDSKETYYSVNNMLSLMKKRMNKQLESEVRQFEVTSFFNDLKNNCENERQKRIFILMDEKLRMYVEDYFK